MEGTVLVNQKVHEASWNKYTEEESRCNACLKKLRLLSQNVTAKVFWKK